MSQLKSSLGPVKSIPAELVGRWKIDSNPPQELYIRFGSNGEYLYSGADLPYSVSVDGQTLNWAGAAWTRYYGSAQDFRGVWRTGVDAGQEEIYFRDNQSTWYTDTTSVLVGIYSIKSGNFALGTMVYEERRGTATVISPGLIHVRSVFGGYSEQAYVLSNGNNTLTIESPIGNIFVYQRV